MLKGYDLISADNEGVLQHIDSDLFKRLLILSVIEKIPSDLLGKDTKRLEEFLGNKAQATSLRACCARKSKQQSI